VNGYLLKYASPFYSHLPENETLTTMLALTLGLPVVDVCLLTAESQTKSSAFVVIGRYDRQGQGDPWTRLHQEDFCQALGISALNKV